MTMARLFRWAGPAMAALLAAGSMNTNTYAAEVRAEAPLPSPKIFHVRVSDGTELAVAVYLPKGVDKVPALFAASPYRFDNDGLPSTGIFLWKETGPITFYLQQGYAFVHLDVRGTGRSDGRFDFWGSREARDLYEVIEWIAKQP